MSKTYTYPGYKGQHKQADPVIIGVDLAAPDEKDGTAILLHSGMRHGKTLESLENLVATLELLNKNQGNAINTMALKIKQLKGELKFATNKANELTQMLLDRLAEKPVEPAAPAIDPGKPERNILL